MSEEVREQILKVRDTGLTNMFDRRAVQRIAADMELFDLVIFIEEEPRKYSRFILSGEM